MRTRIAACAAAAVIILLGIQPGMAASCERIFSLYSSGVTPKTKTALSGENALAISLHKNGGCGWGTANGQSSLAAAEATALAKCRAFPLNMECKIAGRNGKIIASLSQITKHASTEKPKAVKEVADAPHAGPDITPGEEAGHPQQIPGHANTPKSPPTEMLSRPIHAPTDTAFATGPIPVGKTAGHVQQQPAASQGAATGGGAPSEQPSQSRKGISTAAVPATAQNSSAATQTAAPATVRNSTATEPIPTGETAGHVQQEPDHPIHQDQSAATGSSAPPEQPSVSSSARVPTTAQNSYPQNNGATKNPLPHVSSPVVQPPKGALAPNLASQQPPPTAQLLTNPPNLQPQPTSEAAQSSNVAQQPTAPQTTFADNAESNDSIFYIRSFDQVFAFGTIATSSEICSIFQHPFFGRSRFIKDNSVSLMYTFIDPDNLMMQWLNQRRNHLGIKYSFPRYRAADGRAQGPWGPWGPELSAVANAHFTECLRNLKSSDPQRYENAATLLDSSNSVDLEGCLETKTKKQKVISPEGAISEKEITLRPIMPCYPIGDAANSEKERNNLLDMIILREANGAVRSILDSAEKRAQELITKKEQALAEARQAAQVRLQQEEQALGNQSPTLYKFNHLFIVFDAPAGIGGPTKALIREYIYCSKKSGLTISETEYSSDLYGIRTTQSDGQSREIQFHVTHIDDGPYRASTDFAVPIRMSGSDGQTNNVIAMMEYLSAPLRACN